MQIFDLLTKSSGQFPDNIAVIHDKRRISYHDLLNSSLAVGEFLSNQNYEKGSRVAILFENSIEYAIAYFAISKAGLVVVPLDTSLAVESLIKIINDCQPQAVFFQSRFRRAYSSLVESCPTLKLTISDEDVSKVDSSVPTAVLRDIIDSGSEHSTGSESNDLAAETTLSRELAAIFYTSGSTGNSKGVMLSNLNLISNTDATTEYLKLKSDDSVIVILPFYYIYGNSLLLTHIAVGGTLVIDNRFMYPEVILDTMESEKVTGFSGVPSNFMILLGKSTFSQRKFPHLRYFTQAGGAMAPDVIRRLVDAYPGKEVYVMYGQTEASPRVTWLPPNLLAEKIGSIGQPVSGVTVELFNEEGMVAAAGEVGELIVSGDSVMIGYWNQPNEQSLVLKDGKLFTGDLARKDSEGMLYIVGRKKEIIKSGGTRVSAREVEDCLLSNKNVVEAAVYGVPDELLGEAIKAAIVLAEDVEPDEKELRNFCRTHLGDQKAPKYILFLPELPKYQSGKINKTLLKSMD